MKFLRPPPRSAPIVSDCWALHQRRQTQKSTLSFLHAIERDVAIPIVDWSSIIGVMENRVKVKEHLQHKYNESAQSGFMKA